MHFKKFGLILKHHKDFLIQSSKIFQLNNNGDSFNQDEKTINSGREFFAILFVIGLFSIAGFAQSTNPDTPTVLKQNTIEWKRKAPGKTVAYYYTFEAGPGTVEITTD